MKALKFTISGKTAFFKNCDINTCGDDIYFSFPHIHKIALLGIIGAMLGLNGYRQQFRQPKKEKDIFPEFYDKLKDIKISIVPSKQIFSQKFTFQSNTTGDANDATTLIWKEKWLENVSWDIFILEDDNKIIENIKEVLKNEEYKYHLYLGSNHHFCDVSNYEEIELNDVKGNIYDSIIVFPKRDKRDDVQITLGEGRTRKKTIYFSIPMAMTAETNQYIYGEAWLTNQPILSGLEDKIIYSYNSKNLQFF